MKQLDWKSFAIGVLLTTTLIACVGATSVNDRWDSNQKWDTKATNLSGEVYSGLNPSLLGYEPFETMDKLILWRKRIQ
jgi:hypothetical protein